MHPDDGPDPLRALRGVHCVLEPQQASHAAEMFEVLCDPAIHEFEHEPPASEAALRERYERLRSRHSPDGSQGWFNWVIRLPDGALAGYVQATVHADGVALVAYVLASRHWGRGLASDAVRTMIDELATRHGVHALAAVLVARNERSLALLRRLGFEAGTAADAARFGVEPGEIVMTRVASRSAV